MKTTIKLILFTFLSLSSLAASGPARLLKVINMVDHAISLDSLEMGLEMQTQLKLAKLAAESLKEDLKAQKQSISENRVILNTFQENLLESKYNKILSLLENNYETTSSCDYFEKKKQALITTAHHYLNDKNIIKYWHAVRVLDIDVNKKSHCPSFQKWTREIDALKLADIKVAQNLQ